MLSVPPHPFFSVIIATWNRAHRIRRAVDSLLAQTDADWEALVVDDGGTDDTGTFLRERLADDRLHFVRRPHAGCPVARNAGAALARGEWITFLDSDDAYAPGHLASRRAFIAAHPGVPFIHGGFQVVGPPGSHLVPDADDPGRLIPLSECAVGGTFVIEARHFRRLGGFPPTPYAWDRDLLALALGSGAVARCEDPTYIYHREPGEGLCEEMRLGRGPSAPGSAG